MERDKHYIFIGAHAEQLGSGVMKSKGQRFGTDEFDPENNDTDKGLLADGKVIEVRNRKVPDPTPDATALAAEYGIDTSDLEGTGADGRVTKADVEKEISEKDLKKVEDKGGDS